VFRTGPIIAVDDARVSFAGSDKVIAVFEAIEAILCLFIPIWIACPAANSDEKELPLPVQAVESLVIPTVPVAAVVNKPLLERTHPELLAPEKTKTPGST
jgi:uncharacterized protein YccT (UPF0319 family)